METDKASTFFLKNDGSLWATGGNGNGQLGDGTQINKEYPVRIIASGVEQITSGSRSHSLFLTEDGSCWAMGYNSMDNLKMVPTYREFHLFNFPDSIKQVSAGSHILFR